MSAAPDEDEGTWRGAFKALLWLIVLAVLVPVLAITALGTTGSKTFTSIVPPPGKAPSP